MHRSCDDAIGGADERVARAAWSRIAEPADPAAGAVIALYGASGALDWLRHAAADPHGLAHRSRLQVERWAPRLLTLRPDQDLEALDRVGGTLLIPGDPDWPAGLADLGNAAPHCLWVRGNISGIEGAVGVVGSRASTRYGEHVAAEFGLRLTEHGAAVVSGGAYGIDAATHRGALAAHPGPGTVAVLAGGVDRLYPAGNSDLLQAIAAGGALIAEMPPGSSPGRHRFLARNRIIAAITSATVVVEASHRSGALSTANHAAALLRPLGAVPGPVTSAASAGCHRLLREGQAVCVTSAEDVLELARPAGEALPPEPQEGAPNLLDGLDPIASRVLDALPARGGAEADNLARVSGLAIREVLGALGTLELAGRVRKGGGRWVRVAG